MNNFLMDECNENLLAACESVYDLIHLKLWEQSYFKLHCLKCAIRDNLPKNQLI